MFVAAHDRVRSQPEHPQPSSDEIISSKERMILHLEYHPDGIPRKLIRRTWDNHCGDYLSQDISDGGLGLKKTIIAYSRPSNLRDMLQKAKLQQIPGKEVSTYLWGSVLWKYWPIFLSSGRDFHGLRHMRRSSKTLVTTSCFDAQSLNKQFRWELVSRCDGFEFKYLKTLEKEMFSLLSGHCLAEQISWRS